MLSCGHVTEVPVSDLGWKPADGPARVSAGRLREMTTEFEELRAQQPGTQDLREREHIQRMLAEGWPSPAPEALCYTCPGARVIVACQRIGLLVPRTPEPKPAKPPSQASLQPKPANCDASWPSWTHLRSTGTAWSRSPDEGRSRAAAAGHRPCKSATWADEEVVHDYRAAETAAPGELVLDGERDGSGQTVLGGQSL